VETEWVLPEDLTAASAARGHVTDALTEVGVTDDALDDAVLVASELAANAARHGRPPFILSIQLLDRQVRITVGDHGDSGGPVLADADGAVDTDSGHGRGLALVTALSRAIGWSRSGARLDVWADLDLNR
jgi:anti-sigma regulatory factor (Ser/Thr protein kinase)